MRLRPAQQTAATVLEWLRQDRRVAAGLLVGIEGSAPLDVGASMYVDADGQIDGSVTGGCVEGAVAQEAISLLAGDGRPHVQTYGISDELAGTVGLMCGGTVHIFVHELTEPSRDAAIAGLEALVQERPCTVATLLDGPGAGNKLYVDASASSGTLGGPELLDRNVEREARGLIAHGRSTVRYFDEDGATMGTGLRVYFSVYANAPRMLIFGAIDFSASLAAIADLLGYEVTIADPRRAFLDSARFSSVANTIEAWPQDVIQDLAPGPRDAVLVFTHDAKLDVPALIGAFETEAGYIGALGSRKTTVDRERRLREAGASDADLDRMYAPCGLDIGAATVEETAIAVMAEITAHRAQRSGASLRETSGSVRGERSGPAQVEAAVGR